MFRSVAGPFAAVTKWLDTLARRPGRPARRLRRRPPLVLEALESRLTPISKLIATSFFDGAVYEFNAGNGALLNTLVAPNSGGPLSGPAGVTIGPDGNLYLSSQSNDTILEYNLGSNSLSTFIDSSVLGPIATASGNSVFAPAGLRFGPDGNLYVSLNGGQNSQGGGEVIRFGVTSTGGVLSYNNTNSVVAGNLLQPSNLTFGTAAGDTDSLYVSDLGIIVVGGQPTAVGQVSKVAAATSSPSTTTFVSPGSGGLNFAAGLTWGTDGKLYVVDLGATSHVGNVLQFNADGSFNQVFTQPSGVLDFQFPGDAVFDPLGHLITANLGPARPTHLMGSIDQFNSDGTFSKTLVDSSAFPDTGGSGADSGFSPSELALFPNQPPAITMPGGAVSYTEGQAPVVFDAGATVTDVDSPAFDTGTLTVSFTANGTEDDVLGIGNQGTGAGQVGVSGSNVTFGGTVIGTFTDGTGTTPLVVTFNGNSSPAAAQALLRDITFGNGSQNPSTATRTVQFVVTDGDGGTSNTVTKTVNVTAVDNPPVVTTNAGLTVAEGGTGVITSADLTATDPDNTPAQLTFTVTTAPAHGMLLMGGNAVTSFTQDDLNHNRVSYQHDDSETASDRFSFTVSDGTAITLPATFSITVTPNPPTLTANAGLTLNQGSAAVITSADLAAADPDTTPADLTYSVTTAPAHGSLLMGGTAVTSFTQADINGGLVSYQHDNSETTSDSFVFTVGDALAATTPATFNIVVNLVDQPPVVTTNAGLTLNQGATAVIPATDLKASDPDNTPAELAFTVTTAPAHGSLLKGGNPVTTFTQADINNGLIFYRHDNSETTTDGFSFTVSDGTLTTAATTFAITVNPVNQPPAVTTNAGLTLNQGATAVITSADLAATDPDNTPAQLTFTVTTFPANGVLVEHGVPVGSFTQADINGGLLSYQHNNTRTTSDRFTFTVSDGALSTAPTTFAITITLQPPAVTTNTGLTLNEGATATIAAANLTTTDPGTMPAQLTYTVTTAPAHGSLLMGGAAVTTFTQDDLNNNRVSYQHDDSETAADGFTFTVSDGALSTAPTTFSVTVTPNPPTVTTNTGLTVNEGATAVLAGTNLAAADPGTTPAQLNYTVTTAPAHGSLLKGGTVVTTFTQADLNGGLVSYQHDDSETTNDSFAFTVGDGDATSAPATFSITIVAQPPAVTTNTGLTLNQGATAVIPATDLAATDPGTTPAQLNYTVTTAPAHGMLLKGGTTVTTFTQADLNGGLVSYQHDNTKTASDSFAFTVGDGATSAPATFTITVTLQPPAVTTNTGLALNQGASAVIPSTDLAATDPGTTPAQLTYTVTTAPAHGSLRKSGSTVTSFTQADLNGGLISYQHDNSKTASDSFTFTVGDGTQTTAPATFSITVTLQPPAVTTNTGLTLNQGATVVLGPASLATTDPGTTAAQLTYTVTAAPAHGGLLKNGSPTASFTQDDLNNGRVSYHQDGTAATSDAFTFTVSDGTATTAAATFHFNITPQSQTKGPRAIEAVFVKLRRKKKPALLGIQVQFADNGQVITQFRSPFQTPTFKRIRVQAIDTNGDGVPDAVQVSALRGKRHVSRVISV
jgi:hypothetical protein